MWTAGSVAITLKRGWLIAAAALGLIGLGLLLGRVLFTSDTNSPLDVNPRVPPAEFLYLDNARVLTFLSELEDGLSEGERRTIGATQDVNVGLTTSAIGIGAQQQVTSSLERTVTPTGASRFNRLRNLLQDNEWLHELDADWIENLATRARFLARLHEADEGGFIEVSHVHLTVPPAIAVYLYARRAGNGDTADFVRSIGSNPRVPLSLRAELSPLLLFVGRYASLADQPSPFYGDVNVFGKVVREMPPGEVYIDSETLATYGPAFQWAPTSILRKVKIDQRSLLRDLMADVTVMAPGAVVIPLAIYK